MAKAEEEKEVIPKADCEGSGTQKQSTAAVEKDIRKYVVTRLSLSGQDTNL